MYPFNISGITRFQNAIYIGGGFNRISGINCNGIARWDGTNWQPLDSGVDVDSLNPYKGISKLKVIGNELYAIGNFTQAGGIPVNGFAKWNGTNWSNVHNFPKMASIFDFAFFQNEIYACGIFDSIESGCKVAKWNGSNWVSIGKYGSNKLTVYKGKLYVVGEFNDNTNPYTPGIRSWDGQQWSSVGGGIGTGRIEDLYVKDNKLYAVGDFSFAGGNWAKNIASWDGTNWCGYGDMFNKRILSISSLNDTILIHGYFSKINNDTIYDLAKWVGGNYIDTCGFLSTSVTEINNQISISPNPASTTLRISSFALGQKGSELSLTDLTGKTLITVPIKHKETEINISTFANGIYFLKINNGQAQKLIIQH
jgi:hypothetical protein